MSTRFSPVTGLLCVCFALGPVATSAQSKSPYDVIKEIAGHSTALEHIDTIYRLSEELVFWQSVALMGEEFDWEFSNNTAGTEIMNWTFRLENARGEAEIEAKRAAIAISRNKYLTENQ